MPEPQRPELSIATIELPSDRITFGQIRTMQPEIFNAAEGHLGIGLHELDIVALFNLELTCARKAFAKAMRLPDPCPEVSRHDVVSLLSDAYQEYGLSSGLETGRQLIKQIEAAAVRQAGIGRSPE